MHRSLEDRASIVRSLRELVTGLPRTFWFLWAGTLINRLGSFVYPFLTLYLTSSRGMPVDQAAGVVAVYGLGSFLAAMAGGRLADRIGRRGTLLASLFGGGAAMLALGFAQSTAAIVVCTFVLALIQDMYRPAVSAIIADVVPPHDRPRAFGLQYWAVNFGFAIAPAVAGAMASRSYFWLFAGDAATTFACGVLMLWKVPETRPETAAHAEASSAGQALAPFRDGVFAAFMLMTFTTSLLFFQSHLGMPLDMKAHGLSEGTYGAVIAINGVMIVIFQPFASRVTGGKPRSAVLATAAALIGVGFGIYGALPTLAGYTGGLVIWTTGEIIMAGLSPAIVSDLAPLRLRGTYQGVFHMAWALASLVGPFVAGGILRDHGARTLWGACFVVGLLGAAGHLAIAGPRRQRLIQLRAEQQPVSASVD